MSAAPFLTALLAPAALAAPLLAQIPEPPGPPAATSPLIAYIVTAALAALVLAVALKSSKRTHQD